MTREHLVLQRHGAQEGNPRVALDCSLSLIYYSALWLRENDVAGEMKYRVIHRHVCFDLINYDPLLVSRSFGPELDRGWNKYAPGFLVIAQSRSLLLRMRRAWFVASRFESPGNDLGPDRQN